MEADVIAEGISAIEDTASLFFGVSILDQDFDTLVPREIADDFGIDPRDRIEFARPVGAVVGPSQPGGSVGLPLGGHAIAERGGSRRLNRRGHRGFSSCFRRSVQEAMRDGTVAVDAAVAQERPVATNVLELPQVHFTDQNVFVVVWRLRQHLAEGVAEKRTAPEFQASTGRTLAANVAGFVTHTVDYSDVNTISNGMRALDGAPGIVLCVPVLRLFRRVPADRSRIEQHVCAG